MLGNGYLYFKIFIGLAVALFFAACQSDCCKVEGTVALHDGATLLITPCVADSTLTGDAEQTPPTDTVTVTDGRFLWQTVVDTARLYRIWPSHAPQHYASFFAERGTISISIDSTAIRISGTPLNDQWQALNDTVADYAQRIDRTVRTLIAAGTPPSIVSRRVSLLYEEIEKLIASTAIRNKDNELGRHLASYSFSAIDNKSR